MNTKTYRRHFAPLTFAMGVALAATLVLTACTSSASSATAPSATSSPTSTKQALFGERHVNLCIENKSPSPVTISWQAHVSSNTGSGTLEKGQTFCGEGPEPAAKLTTWDSFITVIHAINSPLLYPFVRFLNSNSSKNYDTNFLAQGETYTTYVKGHRFTTTRTSDDDWIQFTVAITE